MNPLFQSNAHSHRPVLKKTIAAKPHSERPGSHRAVPAPVAKRLEELRQAARDRERQA